MSDLVGNPEDRFSHNEAQLSFNTRLICSSDLTKQSDQRFRISIVFTVGVVKFCDVREDDQ